MKQTTPTKLTSPLYKLIRYLGLDPKTVVWLPLTTETDFVPETFNCLINTMIKKKMMGGQIVFGWILWFERKSKFAEAEFHCVWQPDDASSLIDITPRVDGEQKVCFVPDPQRICHLDLSKHSPITHIYENVKMRDGHPSNGIQKISIILRKDTLLPYLTE